MPLSPKTRLGTYEILGSLGAGGMGEVYRAKDLRLGRDIALKGLPEAVAADADHLARFEREARIVAGLNPPHTATPHSGGDGGSTPGPTPEPAEGPRPAGVATPGGR